MRLINYIFFIILGFSQSADLVQSFQVEEIVGGSLATKGQFKYQLVVLANRKIKCGAGILSNELAIAAGQCFIDTNTGKPINKRFMLATLLNYNVLLNKFSKIFKISKIYIPSSYNPYNRNVFVPYRTEGDIAIIKLKRPFDLKTNKDLEALELPTEPISFIGKEAILAGPGCKNVSYVVKPISKKLKELKEGDGKLSFIKTRVSTNSECDPHYFYPIYPSHICARAYPHKGDISAKNCLTDNGSPLVYGKNTIIGILISSPLDCTEDALSAIYTRVTSYMPFIENVMKNIITDMKVLTLTKMNRFPKQYKLIEELHEN